jgi:hypothetical protein
MGFLDHSTNNIILDAVLTDTGRQFLSRNDGSFSLFKFALGDDEVNYSIISKYGRSVGREKVEKNTPIFEALTNQSQAQKFKLISVSNPNLVRLPQFSFTGGSAVSGDTVTLYTTGGTRGLKTTETLTISQTLLNETFIDVELRDQTFLIDVPNLFLSINDGRISPNNVDNQQRANYVLTRTATSATTGGSEMSFSIGVKSLTQTMFDVYGTGTSKDTIKTYVRVTGMQSGTVKDFAVNIKQTT